MKIKKITYAQSRGAFSLDSVKNNSPELYQIVSNLSISEINKILFTKDFIPLDLVSLIYHTNSTNFLKAIQGYIARVLSTNQDYQGWMKEMNVTVDDMASDIYASMFNSDPNNRGVLNQVGLDGSFATKYNYERAKNPEIANQLKNSLRPNSQGITVPHCPNCEASGVNWPLWQAVIEGEELRSESKIKKDQCDWHDAVVFQKMTKDEFNEILENLAAKKQKKVKEEDEVLYQLEESSSEKQLDSDSKITFISYIKENKYEALLVAGNQHFYIGKLTKEEKEAILANNRTIVVEKDRPKIQCTFKAKIPSFSSFFGYRTIKEEVSKLWNSYQRQHGRKTDFKKIDRLKELQQKLDSTGQLDPQEREEMSSLRRYKEKRDLQFIPGLTRLDAPTPGSEDERDLSERIERKDTSIGFEFSEEEYMNAHLELSNFLDEKEFQLVEGLKPVGNDLLILINKYNNYLEQGDNKSKEEYFTALNNVSKIYSYGPIEDNDQRKCRTCLYELNPKDKYCPMAPKMQKDVFDAYQQADDMNKYQTALEKLDSRVQLHYEQSTAGQPIGRLLSVAFSELEVVEDDLFDDLDDLSMFESLEGDSVEQDIKQATKLNFNDFKRKIVSELSEIGLSHFQGENISDTDKSLQEPPEEKESKIIENAKKIDQLIRRVEEEELIKELSILHRS